MHTSSTMPSPPVPPSSSTRPCLSSKARLWDRLLNNAEAASRHNNASATPEEKTSTTTPVITTSSKRRRGGGAASSNINNITQKRNLRPQSKKQQQIQQRQQQQQTLIKQQPRDFTFAPSDPGDAHLRQSFEHALIYDGLQITTDFQLPIDSSGTGNTNNNIKSTDKSTRSKRCRTSANYNNNNNSNSNSQSNILDKRKQQLHHNRRRRRLLLDDSFVEDDDVNDNPVLVNSRHDKLLYPKQNRHTSNRERNKQSNRYIESNKNFGKLNKHSKNSKSKTIRPRRSSSSIYDEKYSRDFDNDDEAFVNPIRNVDDEDIKDDRIIDVTSSVPSINVIPISKLPPSDMPLNRMKELALKNNGNKRYSFSSACDDDYRRKRDSFPSKNDSNSSNISIRERLRIDQETEKSSRRSNGKNRSSSFNNINDKRKQHPHYSGSYRAPLPTSPGIEKRRISKTTNKSSRSRIPSIDVPSRSHDLSGGIEEEIVDQGAADDYNEYKRSGAFRKSQKSPDVVVLDLDDDDDDDDDDGGNSVEGVKKGGSATSQRWRDVTKKHYQSKPLKRRNTKRTVVLSEDEYDDNEMKEASLETNEKTFKSNSTNIKANPTALITDERDVDPSEKCQPSSTVLDINTITATDQAISDTTTDDTFDNHRHGPSRTRLPGQTSIGSGAPIKRSRSRDRHLNRNSAQRTTGFVPAEEVLWIPEPPQDDTNIVEGDANIVIAPDGGLITEQESDQGGLNTNKLGERISQEMSKAQRDKLWSGDERSSLHVTESNCRPGDGNHHSNPNGNEKSDQKMNETDLQSRMSGLTKPIKRTEDLHDAETDDDNLVKDMYYTPDWNCSFDVLSTKHQQKHASSPLKSNSRNNLAGKNGIRCTPVWEYMSNEPNTNVGDGKRTRRGLNSSMPVDKKVSMTTSHGQHLIDDKLSKPSRGWDKDKILSNYQGDTPFVNIVALDFESEKDTSGNANIVSGNVKMDRLETDMFGRPSPLKVPKGEAKLDSSKIAVVHGALSDSDDDVPLICLKDKTIARNDIIMNNTPEKLLNGDVHAENTEIELTTLVTSTTKSEKNQTNHQELDNTTSTRETSHSTTIATAAVSPDSLDHSEDRRATCDITGNKDYEQLPLQNSLLKQSRYGGSNFVYKKITNIWSEENEETSPADSITHAILSSVKRRDRSNESSLKPLSTLNELTRTDHKQRSPSLLHSSLAPALPLVQCSDSTNPVWQNKLQRLKESGQMRVNALARSSLKDAYARNSEPAEITESKGENKSGNEYSKSKDNGEPTSSASAKKQSRSVVSKKRMRNESESRTDYVDGETEKCQTEIAKPPEDNNIDSARNASSSLSPAKKRPRKQNSRFIPSMAAVALFKSDAAHIQQTYRLKPVYLNIRIQQFDKEKKLRCDVSSPPPSNNQKDEADKDGKIGEKVKLPLSAVWTKKTINNQAEQTLMDSIRENDVVNELSDDGEKPTSIEMDGPSMDSENADESADLEPLDLTVVSEVKSLHNMDDQRTEGQHICTVAPLKRSIFPSLADAINLSPGGNGNLSIDPTSQSLREKEMAPMLASLKDTAPSESNYEMKNTNKHTTLPDFNSFSKPSDRILLNRKPDYAADCETSSKDNGGMIERCEQAGGGTDAELIHTGRRHLQSDTLLSARSVAARLRIREASS